MRPEIVKSIDGLDMENEVDLDLAATETVTELLKALQAGDVEKYRSLMSDSTRSS